MDHRPARSQKSSLLPHEHDRVKRLCLQFEVGGDDAKNVSIRDDIADIFKSYIMKWRLMPDEIGIHYDNRDSTELMHPSAAQLRGKRILASGFSFYAIGTLWAMEDNPETQAIARHTEKVLSSNPEFAPASVPVKVGPLNWTHSNQFVRMVDHARPCADSELPTKGGCLDRAAIQGDPKNAKMFAYMAEGMVCDVFPYWVESQYPAVVKIFQSACNQEQQVQEGRLAQLFITTPHPKELHRLPNVETT